MKVEIGHKIQEVFESKNIKLTEFADQLGTVRQNVYRIFKKTHVDTGLLLKVSQVLDHNFFQYYVNTSDNTRPNVVDDVSSYERKLELATKEIAYLRKIIRLMEEKSELLHKLDRHILPKEGVRTNVYQ